MSPDGLYFTYCQRDEKSACIHKIADGEEVQKLVFTAPCDGAHWSPDGSRFVCHGGFGAKVYDTSSWKETHSLMDPNFYIGDCRAAPATTGRIATCGASTAVIVRELSAGGGEREVVKYQEPGFTASLCFDPTGERLAYSYVDFVNYSPPRELIKIVSATEDKVLHTIGADRSTPEFKAHVKGFSPGGRWLLCYESADTAGCKGGILVVDTETGMIEPWSRLLGPLLLRGGAAARYSVGWIRQEQAEDDGRLMIHASSGNELLSIDLRRFEDNYNDGCFSAAALSGLTNGAPQLISTIIRHKPFAINIRAPYRMQLQDGGGELESGDTVLHYCARNAHDRMQAWLEDNIFHPIANNDSVPANDDGFCRFGRTAMHVSISAKHILNLRMLTARLHDHTGQVSALLINDFLGHLATTMPEYLPEILVEIEPKVFQTQNYDHDRRMTV
eukprot:SAG22_NODE_1083_length_5646_cov_8.060934_2_plen_445_part_00